MVRAMCGRLVIDKKTAEEQMTMLAINKFYIDWQTQMALHGKDTCREEMMIRVLTVALNLEMSDKRERGSPKKTWKKIGSKEEDALN